MNIPPQSRLKLYAGTTDPAMRSLLESSAEQIKRLARVEEINIFDALPSLESAARDIVSGVEIGVPLGGLIDFAKERERITREMTRKENETRGLKSRLDNPSFVERAPGEVVAETRGRLEELTGEIEKLRSTLRALDGN
jgi:valyl-tRNA synthetase